MVLRYSALAAWTILSLHGREDASDEEMSRGCAAHAELMQYILNEEAKYFTGDNATADCRAFQVN